ncbi:hypothetical protein [Spirosoma arcticum]
MKLKNDSVALVAGRTATGSNADELSREFMERTKNVKPLVSRDEIDAWIEEKRRVWQQKQQQ